MNDTISTAALADLVGVTVRTITDLAKRGIIVREGRGYALAASVRGYCDHSGVLRAVGAGMLAVPSRCQQRLPASRHTTWPK